MKYTLALIARTVAAYDHGFPNDDSFHAYCHLNVTLANTTCADAVTKANTLINTNVDTDSQWKG